MKRSKCTEDQIALALKQQKLGTSVDEVAARWASARRLLSLEEEVRRHRATGAEAGRGSSRKRTASSSRSWPI